MKVNFGMYWDSIVHNKRLIKFSTEIDYLKALSPLSNIDYLKEFNLPVYLRSNFQALSNENAPNQKVLNLVKEQADFFDGDYITEDLGEYRHNLVFNNIYNQKKFETSLKNIKYLQSVYQRPIAISLGAHYQVLKENFHDEIDFLIKLAFESDSKIVLDLTSLMITNYNLNRSLDYGIEKILKVNVVEVEVSGIQVSANGRFWTKTNTLAPSVDTLNLLKEIKTNSLSLKNITWNQSSSMPEKDFLNHFELLMKAIR